jgi:hypothetical protein
MILRNAFSGGGKIPSSVEPDTSLTCLQESVLDFFVGQGK